jgi:hypothetical protein
MNCGTSYTTEHPQFLQHIHDEIFTHKNIICVTYTRLLPNLFINAGNFPHICIGVPGSNHTKNTYSGARFFHETARFKKLSFGIYTFR